MDAPPPPSAGKNARPVSAGFGSPGDDFTVKRIDLNDALIRHPEATYAMRAQGAAMHDAGIDDGDVLLVDRSLEPTPGRIIVAIVDGELLCRRLAHSSSAVVLQAAHAQYADITLTEEQGLQVWGVVTTVIKNLLT